MRGIWDARPAAPALQSVKPTEMDRVTLAAQESHGFVERQTDDVGIGTDDLYNKGPGDALRSITARLAAPFAGGEVGLDVLVRQPLETNTGLHVALTKSFLRRYQTNGCMNAMVAAGEQPEALRRFVAQPRGNSPRFGVSSMSAGRSASGSMPA